MKKILILVAVLAVLAGGGLYAYRQIMPKEENSAASKANENTIAIVNGKAIPRALYESELSQTDTNQPTIEGLEPEPSDEVKQQVVNNLVERELLIQAVEASGIKTPDEEVDKQIQAAKSQFETENEYKKALSDQGKTEEELRSQTSYQLAQQEFLNQKLNLDSIEVTDEEIKSLYEQASESQKLPPLKDVKQQVEQLAIQQKQQNAINQFIQELRSKANIEIFL